MNTELDFIRGMFDRIAPKYDFLNRLLSLRQDVRWRREMVEAADLTDDSAALDAACGTCDVALEIEKRKGRGCRITGMDFSLKMLYLGAQKAAREARAGKIRLTAGNALHLPFKKESFNAVFIAFGIRNIMDRKSALENFRQVLKKGGRVVVLELTTPSTGLMRSLYLFYFRRILPMIGRLFSKSQGAYSYLPESVLGFPSPGEFAAVMRSAGFSRIRWKPMTFGIVTLFVGYKDKGDRYQL
ncbi:MAG: bifunctional demethylmenaquinone methyltransferase/2-methoxy-6-polyprenyl-1,4-benzoquinol methylase UbiE [Desulfarculaceae bacterium]|nr:bifunctional demethylmenaquinone methyltransferase/2-methoxy-6-polyprenyl-1,4-benzoquinol methylase UbiE [Desulfarculaceae bacterium]